MITSQSVSSTPSIAAPSIDEHTKPREIRALAEYLTSIGEPVKLSKLFRWIREGKLPVARVGRMTSTAAAYFAVRSPKVG